MAPKKTLKVNESDPSIVVEKEEIKTSKITKSKKKDELETLDKEVKASKSKKSIDVDTSNATEPKPLKTKKAVVETSEPAEETPKPKKETKPKKVKTEEEKVTKPKKETKTKKSIEQDVITHIEEPVKIDDAHDPESQIKQKLENTKKQWLLIVNNIQTCHAELEKLEQEKNKTVKELKELLDQLDTDDPKIKGFLIDQKVTSGNIKNDIIPVDSESSSESDNESEGTDSDEKPTILTKKGKTKSLIKTTKGNAKNIKLVANDSESDSD